MSRAGVIASHVVLSASLTGTATDTAAATDSAVGVYVPFSIIRNVTDTAPATNALTRTVARSRSTANTAAAADTLIALTNIYDNAVLADSPLVYWKMAETGTTTLADSSGNSRTGTMSATIVPATSIVSGQARGNAFTNDSATIADATWQDQANWSVEIWFAGTDAGAARGLACRDNAAGARHWDLHLNEVATGRVDIRAWTTNTASQVTSTSTTLNDGNRHHAVATYNGATLILYIDGASTGTPVSVAGLNSNVTSPIRVGGHTGLTGVTATLQAFAYYPTALSSGRVAAHYAAGTA